jgi:hypothetical protein
VQLLLLQIVIRKVAIFDLQNFDFCLDDQWKSEVKKAIQLKSEGNVEESINVLIACKEKHPNNGRVIGLLADYLSGILFHLEFLILFFRCSKDGRIHRYVPHGYRS